MKKLVFVISLFIGATQCMYHPKYPIESARKLKYTDITLTNKSPILLELSWTEITEEGNQQVITKEIMPGTTIEAKLGEFGAYFQSKPAKITYKPTSINDSIKQEFTIDLPNSKAFAFTAVTMADIMKNIWVPGVFTADDEGKFGSFQYMNLHHPTEWELVLRKIGTVKSIK